MAPLAFGDLGARDAARRGKPLDGMYASFGGPDRAHLERLPARGTRPGGGQCTLYNRTSPRCLTWPPLAYSCGRFEPKTPNTR